MRSKEKDAIFFPHLRILRREPESCPCFFQTSELALRPDFRARLDLASCLGAGRRITESSSSSCTFAIPDEISAGSPATVWRRLSSTIIVLQVGACTIPVESELERDWDPRVGEFWRVNTASGALILYSLGQLRGFSSRSKMTWGRAGWASESLLPSYPRGCKLAPSQRFSRAKGSCGL